MNERDLAVRLAQHGVRAYTEGRECAIANADPHIKQARNAAIASTLELMGKVGLVVDAQPWFDADGIGFAYRLGQIPEDQSEAVIARWVLSTLEPATSSTSESVKAVLRDCEHIPLNGTYSDDLRESLRELAICFDERCYIACLALCGKILEISLKQLLLDSNVEFDDGWMIGRLLRELRERNVPKYLDPSLQQVGEIINRSRIPAVHALERVPIPSEHQAAMVISATIDTVRRTIVTP